MKRAAVKVAYLGENFSGSQIQPGFRTAGGDILSDLKTITKLNEDEIDLKLASRTDKGVNALGNVAVFNSNIEDPDILLRALNAVSKDIFYRGVAFVDEEFNPRFADVRRYRYILRSHGLDISAVKECAELFTGEHNFSRFCRHDDRSSTTSITSIEVRTDDDLVILDFTARYFLWNMVRRIVAAIVSVGRGDAPLSDVKDALEGKDFSFGIARADALTLMDVYYERVEFITPPANVLDRRIEEEMFKSKLRNSFFASL